jgi:hypothetical protein
MGSNHCTCRKTTTKIKLNRLYKKPKDKTESNASQIDGGGSHSSLVNFKGSTTWQVEPQTREIKDGGSKIRLK